MKIPVYHDDLPWITALQMREVDRIMTEEIGVDLLQMMELAGWNLSRLVLIRFLGNAVSGKKVAVMAGRGGNGGGAMAGARILSNHGVKVEIFLSSPPEKSSKWVRKQHNILKNMDIKVVVFDGENFPKKVDLIIDGLIGYSLTGKPAGTVREMIEWANGSDALILSLDMPTGVNPDTGESEGAHINAHGTLTLALPKVGLKPPSGRKCSGELYLADIGIPPSLYEKPSLGFPVPNIFNESPIVRIY